VSAESQPPPDESSRPPLRIAPAPTQTDETTELTDAVAHMHDATAQAQARAALRQGIAERVPGAMPVTYIGLISRAIAFAIDTAIILLVAVIVGGAIALITSLFPLPHAVKVIIAAVSGAVYGLWIIGFFVAFWSGTGQTPGARVMDFRVVTSSLERVGPRRALIRCGGTVLAAIPLFAGFLPVTWDPRCRGLADYLAGTVVVEAPCVVIPPHGRRGRLLRDREAAEAARDHVR